MRLAINRAIIASIVAIFASFSIIGVLQRYSLIPNDSDYWDYLGFYADLLDGKYLAWFAPFAGHRPILPRGLFWLDVRFFGGRFVFLIVANLVILCGIIAILIAYLRRLTSERRTQFVIGATICIMALSWLHQFNLASGVSGAQYFMAIFLPLVAFYWLARAQEERYFFSLAVLAGFASAWTHGNGVLVLPLLATFALCIGLKTARIGTLIIASVSTIALYFYFARNEQSSIFRAYWSTLTGDPISAVRFTLGFLGNPFFIVVSYPLAFLQYLITGAGQATRPIYGSDLSDYPIAFAIGFYIAQAAGAILIVTAVILARRWFTSGREVTFGALLIFLFFIILTAAACAAVRFNGGLQLQYATPALFAWITLIVLGAFSFNLRRTLVIFACAAICLFPTQMLPIFGPWRATAAAKHEHELLAIEAILRGSNNPKTLSILGADLDVVRRLRGTKVSIFADGP